VLRGAMPINEEQESKKPPNPVPKLLSKLNYDIIYSSQLNIPAFADMIKSIEENTEAWTKWATSDNPH